MGNESSAAAAVAVATAHGLNCKQPVVLREAWHVLVHLAPSPVVARASSSLPYPQGPDPEAVVREFHVARHAAAAGAPVIPPTEDPDRGPHHHEGHVVTFWRYVEPRGQVDADSAGRELRLIHDALADYDGPTLPIMGRAHEVDDLLATVPESADVDLLRTLAARRPDVDGQALHGDAHLDNVLRSGERQYWHDLECASHGAPEYDLAALVLRDRAGGDHPAAREALAAYGPHDRDLVEQLVPIYAAWIYASFLVAVQRRPELAPVLDDRLRWLRSYA
jgi:hypothetical protein